MTRIDTSAFFNDEFSYATVIYLVIGLIVIYIAWLSTFVRHETRDIPYRQRTVFIFNPQTGDFQQHSLGILLNNLSSNLAQATPTFESILDEMNGISYRSPQQQQDDNTDDDSVIEEETQEIIREMDREPNDGSSGSTSGLRNRRTTNNTRANTATNNLDSVDNSSDIALSSLESSSSVDSSINNTNSTITTATTTTTTSTVPPESIIENSPQSSSVTDKTLNYGEITIKLKYLSDALKIVKARPTEAIGDFIKRNFNEELTAQKIVRLVFNGHVLQPDAKTVAACGLFDNCVVHCLIHNPRPTVVPESNPLANNPTLPLVTDGPTEQIGRNNLINSNQNRNRNTQRLLNLSLFLICLSVIISWFFRIQYFQLFSWYSTVGLVLLTTFFLVIIPLIFLIEREIFRNL